VIAVLLLLRAAASAASAVSVLTVPPPLGVPLGLDPTPYTAWGVLGLLGVVILVGLGIIWRLFVVQTRFMESRDSRLMSFVDTHRQQFAQALADIVHEQSQALAKMAAANDKSMAGFTRALNRQARGFDEVLLADRAYNKLASLHAAGVTISHGEIEGVIREIIRQRSDTDETLT